MDLKGWEMDARTASPITGASVQAVVASDTHPNPGGVVASTTTDPNGMWELNGLADADSYDVKVTANNGRIKWYKGRTRHSVGHVYDDSPDPPGRNLLVNGGFDTWIRNSSPIVLPTSRPVDQNGPDYWHVYVGTGDSGSGARDTTTTAINSQASLQIGHTRASGQATAAQDVTDVTWQGLKGQEIALSVQVLQNQDCQIRAFIDDGITVTFGEPTSTTGAWTTVGVTATVSASATRVRVGMQTTRSDTGIRAIRVDNAMLVVGSVVPEYVVDRSDPVIMVDYAPARIVESAPTLDAANLATILNNLAERVRAIVGAAGNDWKDAVPRTLTQLLADVTARLPLGGGTMSGNLLLNNLIAVQGKAVVTGLARNLIYRGADDRTVVGDGVTGLLLVGNDSLPKYTHGAGEATIWTSQNDGPTSGLSAEDSAKLGGVAAAGYSAVAHTHTGTTISDLTSADMNSASVDGLAGTASMRTLGPGSQQAAAGSHLHDGVYLPYGDYASGSHGHLVVAAGSYTGSGSVLRAISLAPGFLPVLVIVTNASGATQIITGADNVPIVVPGGATASAGSTTLSAGQFTTTLDSIGVTHHWVAIAALT